MFAAQFWYGRGRNFNQIQLMLDERFCLFALKETVDNEISFNWKYKDVHTVDVGRIFIIKKKVIKFILPSVTPKKTRSTVVQKRQVTIFNFLSSYNCYQILDKSNLSKLI